MLWLTPDPYELIRSRQRELQLSATRARRLAAAWPGGAGQARRTAPGRLSRAAQLLRAALARP